MVALYSCCWEEKKTELAMSELAMSMGYCVKENKPCIGWVQRYFKDCLCNVKDDFSFAFGLASVVCWGVAEIPQIISNFKTKSSHGVSLLFLLTWIVGDVFNLVGCLLEPATLPTQLYAAVLYSASTVVLVLQCVYYDHIYSWCKHRRTKTDDNMVEDEKIPLKSSKASTKSNPRPNSTSAAIYGTFLAVTANLPLGSKAWMEVSAGLTSRRLLQDQSMEHSAFGQWLGWLMASIYMGGRIPQICLNIKRGSVEGLNPLMFIFALIANATYAASILVRTSEWDRIKAIMPWLLDALVCVALDLFILLQYIYYKFFRKSDGSEECRDYMAASKEVVP